MRRSAFESAAAMVHEQARGAQPRFHACEAAREEGRVRAFFSVCRVFAQQARESDAAVMSPQAAAAESSLSERARVRERLVAAFSRCVTAAVASAAPLPSRHGCRLGSGVATFASPGYHASLRRPCSRRQRRCYRHNGMSAMMIMSKMSHTFFTSMSTAWYADARIDVWAALEYRARINAMAGRDEKVVAGRQECRHNVINRQRLPARAARQASPAAAARETRDQSPRTAAPRTCEPCMRR